MPLPATVMLPANPPPCTTPQRAHHGLKISRLKVIIFEGAYSALIYIYIYIYLFFLFLCFGLLLWMITGAFGASLL